MKRMTRKYYYERAKQIKKDAKERLNNLRREYKSSGEQDDDAVNSIYVRKVYYAITKKNIKRDGLWKFFLGKFLAERRYYYYKSIRKPANLECKWYWPKVSDYDIKHAINTQAFCKDVLNKLHAAGEELFSKTKDVKIQSKDRQEVMNECLEEYKDA